MFGEVELAATYLGTRLSLAQNATNLPASARFDLARLNVSDDELEEIVNEFRDTPMETQGWGFADMLQEITSRSPRSVEVDDLAALQKNLVAQGYLPPDHPANGQWDPVTDYGAFKRWDRDTYEKQRQGYHWYSAPIESGFTAITNTLPSRVFQGLVGAAKGIVLQAPESAERLGALGGAASGAAIGAAVGSVVPGLGTGVGALAGAAVGGVAGFASDFFGEEDDEVDQSAMARLVDAISPYEEYREQGPKAMWEDLGFTLSAASMVSGVGMAAKGATGAVRGVQALRAGSPGITSITPQSARLAAAAPGVAHPVSITTGAKAGMPLGKALMAPTTNASQVELGAVGTIYRWATMGKTVRAGSPAWENFRYIRWSPTAFMNRAGPRVALEGFAGLSQAQMGARMFGGIGQGSKQDFLNKKAALEAKLGRDLNEEERAELSERTARSTIEQSIASAPLLQTGVKIPLLNEDIVDLAAFALYPKRLLPFTGLRAQRAAVDLMGDVSLEPFVLAVQHQHEQVSGRMISVGEAKGWLRENLDPVHNAYIRADFGIDRIAHDRVFRAYGDRRVQAFKARAHQKARADVVSQINKELEAGTSETLAEAIKYSEADPSQFASHLIELNNRGSGLDKLENWKGVNQLSRDTEKLIQDQTRLVRGPDGEVRGAEAWLTERFVFEGKGGPVTLPRKKQVPVGGVTRSGPDNRLDVSSVKTSIKQLDNRIKRYEQASKRATHPTMKTKADERLRLAQGERTRLQHTLTKLESGVDESVDIAKTKITPAREDFLDRQTLYSMRDELDAAQTRVREARTPNEELVAQAELENLIARYEMEGMIWERLPKDLTSKRILEDITDYAKGAPVRIDLPEELATRWQELGYKPVMAGDDVLYPDQLSSFAEVGIGDYTRRAAFWETIALSPRLRNDKALGQLKAQTLKTELGHALEMNGVKLTPDAAMRRLHEHMEDMNHGGAVFGPATLKTDKGWSLYKVNPRDLSVNDIVDAFGDIPGVDDRVAREIFAALRRGSAYGGEVRFAHPIDSARRVGRAMRLEGLPGFSEAVRTWHAEVPGRLNARAWRQEKLTYTPPSHEDTALDLAHAAHRRPAVEALRETAERTGITPQERQVAEMFMDATAVSQVKAGHFDSVDSFYEHVSVSYAERYAGEAGLNALFKRVKAAPSHQKLVELADEFRETKDWYSESARAIANLPLRGTTKLGDKDVSDIELFTNILAAVSPRQRVGASVDQAVEVFESIKRGDESWPKGILPVAQGMLDDILTGKTIDVWGPARAPQFKTPRAKNLPWYRRQNELLEPIPKAMRDRERGMGMEAAMDIGRELAVRGPQAAEDYVLEKIRIVRSVLDDNRMTPLAGEDLKLAKEFKGLVKKAPNRNLQQVQDLTEAVMNGKVDDAQRLLDDLEGRLFASTEFHTRPKVENFYWNLKDELGRVTNDSWMSKLFGYDGTFTTAQYDEVTTQVKRVADDLGWEPAQVQAALWAAVREEYSVELLEESRRLKKLGDLEGAEALRLSALDELDMATIEQYLDPAKVEKLTDLSNGKAMAYLQRVEDEVMGLTALGQDGVSIMKFFRNADFSTLVHENGHLLRLLMPDEEIRQLEKAYGASFLRTAPGKRVDVMSPRTKAVRTSLNEMHGMLDEADSGFTWDPHTGQFSEWQGKGAGTAVALPPPDGRQTWLTINPGDKAYTDPAEFRKRVSKLMSDNDLAPENYRVGGWHEPETGKWHIDLSEVTDRDTAIALGHQRGQIAVTDIEAGETLYMKSTPAPDTVAAEERFARDVERILTGKTTAVKSPAVDTLKSALGATWARMRGASVETNLVPREVRKVLDKTLDLPQYASTGGRRRQALGSVASKQTGIGAAGGAAAGAYEGREDGILDKDLVAGAMIGAAGGLGTRAALNRTYGYLPDALARMNTALRYTLSFTFDAGRLTEQNMLAMTRYGLPPMMKPKNYTMARKWKSPYSSGLVTGDAAWRDAIRFWDELNGTTYFQNLDDLDRRLFQRGMLGFSPRNWETAQAWQMYQLGWDTAKIEEAVSTIGRYGIGRTAAEKSANFIVFPFSFSKKMLTSLGDFVFQTPGRNLLIHEGLRRYYESEADEKVGGFLEKNVPLLEELKMINNLAFGISPGRFFLQGLSDHRTNTGKVMQLLSSFVVPSGAATPLQEAAGYMGDAGINAFLPVVITGDSISQAGGDEGLGGVFTRYVPFMRELETYFYGENSAFWRQWKATTEGADPYYQLGKYIDGVRETKDSLRPLAVLGGYKSVDGYLQSDMGAGAASMVEARQMQLAGENPTGAEMVQSFESSSLTDKKGLYDLANKEGLSSAEEVFLRLVEDVERFKQLGTMLNLDPDQVRAMTASSVRSNAANWADDRRFAELWERFLEREFGPIRRVA